MKVWRLVVGAGLKFCVAGVLAAAPIDDLDLRPTQPTPANAQSGVNIPELEAATLAFKKGKLDDCKELLDAGRERARASGAGELPPTNLMLARLYIGYGNVAAGRSLLEQVAVEHAGHPEVYLLFGNLAVNEGRLADAMLHFEKALEVTIPKTWTREQISNMRRESYAGQARVSELREDWFNAQVALKQWSIEDSGNAMVRDRLGAALFSLGREREAFDQFQTSARQDKTLNPPEVSMAVMYARAKDFDKSRQVFEAALKKYPTDGRVPLELSSMLLLNDQPRDAKQFADKAAELGINTPEFIMQRGIIARQLKLYAEAEGHFTKLLDKSPSNFEAMNQLALVLVEQNDKAKQGRALQLAELNARRMPESSFALSTLGWVQYRTGNASLAEQTLRLAAAKPSVRTETLYYLVRVLWENGQRADARRVAERAKAAFDEPGLFVLRGEAKQWMSSESL